MLDVEPAPDARTARIKEHLERYVAERCPEKEVASSCRAEPTAPRRPCRAPRRERGDGVFISDRRTIRTKISGSRNKPARSWAGASSRSRCRQRVSPDRFLDLFFEYGCAKKTEAECLFPLLDVIRAVTAEASRRRSPALDHSSRTTEGARSPARMDPASYWNARRRKTGVGRQQRDSEDHRDCCGQGLRSSCRSAMRT